MPDKIIVGITDCSKYPIYRDWVLSYNDRVEVIQLGYKLDNFEEITNCDGIVLTGGEDIDPKFYKRPDYHAYCHQDDVDEKRDLFEFKILEYTEQYALPVLGICRGMQVGNVYFGGTLIPDIPSWGKFNHGKMPDQADRYHEVLIDPASWLAQIVQTERGLINSNHHQSVNKIGKGLVVSALSADGIAEAMERLYPDGRSFLCLVQWHPERIREQQGPFSKNLYKAFIEAIIRSKR